MPDPSQLSFWDNEADDMWEELDSQILEILIDGVGDGISQLPPAYQVLADWDLINNNVLDYAKKYRYDLIKGITDTTKDLTQKAIADWILEGSSLSSLIARIETIFDNPVRAEMIAITETTRLYAEGNRQAWESTGYVGQMVWMTAEDEKVCPICSPLAGTHVGIGDKDAIPPAHPRCRCWLQPVVSVEAVGQQLDEVFK